MSLNQSRFLYHRECPRCRENGKDKKGNNLGVYDDGHTHCFSCDYHTHSYTVLLLEKAAEAFEIKRETGPKGIYLPKDTTSTIDMKALEWLNKFGIKVNEVKDNGLLWSDFYKWLIFPIKAADGQLLAWQARNFHHNEQGGPKWKTIGPINDITHLMGEYSDVIVLVEDIVSGIKVSRHAQTMPLFGSHLGLAKLAKLRHLTKKLVIWLDRDKYAEAIKFADNCKKLNIECVVVYTERDPKECADEQIIANVTI